MEMRYAMIGGGAIGGYYAGLLARAGTEVHLLLRSDAEYVSQNGLQIDSIHGDFKVQIPFVYSDWQKMPACDVVCIALKSTQNFELWPMLERITRPGSILVVLQNGYGIEQEIQSRLPDRILLGGLCFICAHKVGPGHIKHLDYGSIRFGSLKQGGEASDALAEVAAEFSNAGVETHLSADLQTARWQKLCWNIPFNGLCTLLGANTSELLQDPETFQLIQALMAEVQNGARICGVDLSDTFVEKMIRDTRNMQPYKPSMQLDFEMGRPLEWEVIYKAPVDAVLSLGGEMPKTQALMQQLAFKSRQKGEAKPDILF
jgi:2-dehydropantoate 2-reductase